MNGFFIILITIYLINNYLIYFVLIVKFIYFDLIVKFIYFVLLVKFIYFDLIVKLDFIIV